MVAFWSTKQDNSPSAVAGRDETQPTYSQELAANGRNPAELDELETLAKELISLFEDLDSVAKVEKTKLYKHSRIRVQLSRPLTVAEVEQLTTDHNTIGGRLNVPRREDDGFLVKLRVSPNRTHVWVDADLPSRLLFKVVAAALDAHFVNVFPKAVRTFTEYHA